MNFYTTSIIALVSFYILLLIVVFFFQRNLLYHPSINNYLKNQDSSIPTEVEKVNITTNDKIELVGWFYKKNLKRDIYLFWKFLRISLNIQKYLDLIMLLY